MDSTDNLTSYLKSMFAQINGDAGPTSVAAVASSGAPKAAVSADDQSMIIESQHVDEETIVNLKEHEISKEETISIQEKEHLIESPAIEKDINNNETEATATVEATPSVFTNDSRRIEVNVDVHHSHNDLMKETMPLSEPEQETNEQTTVPPSVAENKIVLSFLDELKQSLQVNSKPDEEEELPPVVVQVTEKSPPETEETTESESKPGSEVDKEPLVEAASITQVESSPEEKTVPTVSGTVSPVAVSSPVPGSESSRASSVHEDAESGHSASEDISTESGIDDHFSAPTSQSSQPSSPEAHSANRLSRSLSSDSSGSNSSGRRVVMRSVSQDVRFKLASIKEEKKVTKSHVSELANFWKDRIIATKEKQ